MLIPLVTYFDLLERIFITVLFVRFLFFAETENPLTKSIFFANKRMSNLTLLLFLDSRLFLPLADMG